MIKMNWLLVFDRLCYRILVRRRQSSAMHETISTTRARTPPRRMTQQTKAGRQPRTPLKKKNHKLIQEPDRSRHQQKVLNDPTQGVMSMECRNIVNRLPTRLLQSKSTPDAPSRPLPTLINSAIVCNWLQTFYIQCITIVIYYLNVFIALINKVNLRFL